MRIALVVTGGLHPGGRREVVPGWIALLDRLARAHDVHAFVLRHLPDPVSYPLAGAVVHDLGRPNGRWSQWRALGRALDAQPPFDVIHGLWVDPAGLLAALAGRRRGVPSVVTCDSGEFTALPDIGYGLQVRPRGRAAVRLACGLATRVHVTTRFMASLAHARGLDVVRIPMGVDVTRIEADHERSEGPPWQLVQMASLNAVKDQTVLLRAVARARRTLDLRLDVIGEDTLAGRLQREALAMGLADIVTFHGFVPHDELPAFRRRAHLYVQSSRHEAAGMAVLEAAAAGLPVVGTRVGYVSDWAPAGARAVPVGDADALGEAIVELVGSPRQRRALADAARQFARAHDVDWSASRLVLLYESLSG